MGQLPGVTPRILEYTVSIIISILLSGVPLQKSPGSKTNYALNLNKLLITRPILNLNMSMDRASQDLKLCFSENFLLETSRTDFLAFKFHDL